MSTPYRDDAKVLEDRLADLEKELGVLRDRLGELGDLKKSEADLEQEITRVRARLEARRPRSLLDNVRIASPCNASWDDMAGDNTVRFCGQCQKNVFNLSAMSREEAERLLRERAGSLCARIYKRQDGTVLTEDCSVGVRKKRVRRLAMATVGGGMLAAGALLTSRQGAVAMQGDIGPAPMGTVAVDTRPPEREMMMGEMIVDTTTVKAAAPPSAAPRGTLHADPPKPKPRAR